MDAISINIGGKIFVTQAGTLKSLPDTKLAGLSKEYSPEFNNAHGWFYFDRNSTLFECILDLYRCGSLHVPHDVCGGKVIEELDFWEIPHERVDYCCYGGIRKYKEDTERMKDLKNKLNASVVHFPSEQMQRCRLTRFREYVWSLIEYPESSRSAAVYACLYYLLVLLTCITFVINTHPAFRDERQFSPSEFAYVDANNATQWVHIADYLRSTQKNPKVLMYILTKTNPVIYVTDVTCYFIFTLDLLVRFLVTPSKKRLLKSFMVYFDIILVISNTIAFGLQTDGDILKENDKLIQLHIACHSLVILRLCRLLNLTRHLNGLKILTLTFKSSLKDLCQLALPLLITVLLVSGIMYYAEFTDHQSFPNIPITIWWCVVTMTTVGYGDVTPTTYIGYSIASFCAVLGLILIAMPVAIIASTFGEMRNIYAIKEQKDALSKGCEIKTTLNTLKHTNSNKVWCILGDKSELGASDDMEITDIDVKDNITNHL